MAAPHSPLAGRVALVTGTSRLVGIGAAIARRLAADGAHLFLTSWAPHDSEQPWGGRPDDVLRLVDELAATGCRVEHMAADLAAVGAPRHLYEAAHAIFGHVDILVANHARSSLGALGHLSADEIDLTYAVNVRATLLLVQEHAARHDDARPGGRVVLFTSGQHQGAMPDELPYVASKAALHGLTRSLALPLARRGITVNCINPGPTDTGWATPERTAAVLDQLPMGRWGTPEDAARVVAWLVSDEARWLTGQVIDSHGGFGL